MATVMCDFDSRASPSTSDSITDASEDSVDVKVKPVAPHALTLRTRNKRKSAEPRKLKDVPVMKRHRWTLHDNCDREDEDEEEVVECVGETSSRVQSNNNNNINKKKGHRDLAVPSTSSLATWTQKKQKKYEMIRSASGGTSGSANVRGTKGARKKCKVSTVSVDCPTVSENKKCKGKARRQECPTLPLTSSDRFYSSVHGTKTDFSSLGLPFDVRNILGPSASTLLSVTSPIAFERLQSVGMRHLSERACFDDSVSVDFDVDAPKESETRTTTPCSTSYLPEGDIDGLMPPSDLMSGLESSSNRHKQRNYKNMTKERRIEANARERTRVHTISAAFDNLRRAVPAYSCHQKLSKLAILRIACSYILALASLNDQDYSSQQDCPTFSECVDLCTRTIQSEGKARKRKE